MIASADRTLPAATLVRASARETAAVTVLVAFALAVRAVVAHRNPVMFNDGPVFLEIAQRFAAGDWKGALAHDYHPLYSFCVLIAHFAFPDWERAAVAVSVTAGAFAVLFLHLFLRPLFGVRTALAGALLLAVHPYAIRFSADVQSDGLYLALFLAALAGLATALARASASLAGWAGVASGLAYLARPEGLGVALIGVGLAGLWALRGRIAAPRAVGLAAACAGGALLFVVPYATTLRVHHGEWRLTQKKSVGALAGLEEAEGEHAGGGVPGAAPAASARSDVPAPGPAAPSKTPPAAPARASRPDGPTLVSPDSTRGRPFAAASDVLRGALATAPYEIAVLLALGIWARRGRPGEPGEIVGATALLYAVVLFALALKAGYVSRRHLLPPLVAGFGYAAEGAPLLGGLLLAGVRRIARRPALRREGAALALGLGLAVAIGLVKGVRVGHPNDLAERRAAEWLRSQGEPQGAVAAMKQRTAWYAGAPFVALGAAPRGALEPYLRERGVRYVIVDEDDATQIEELQRAKRAWQLVHREESDGDAALVLALGAAPAPPGEPPRGGP